MPLRTPLQKAPFFPPTNGSLEFPIIQLVPRHVVILSVVFVPLAHHNVEGLTQFSHPPPSLLSTLDFFFPFRPLGLVEEGRGGKATSPDSNATNLEIRLSPLLSPTLPLPLPLCWALIASDVSTDFPTKRYARNRRIAVIDRAALSLASFY